MQVEGLLQGADLKRIQVDLASKTPVAISGSAVITVFTRSAFEHLSHDTESPRDPHSRMPALMLSTAYPV